jgi:very-short-patch-repair endonuclease
VGFAAGGGGDVEVVVLRAGGRSREGITVHVTRSLDASEVTSHESIPCTSPARTLLDLAGVSSRRQLRRALERSLELRLFDGTAVHAALGRASGRRGARLLREVLAGMPLDEPAPARSEIERRFVDLVRDEGLPLPVVNGHVGVHQVDFHWPSHRLVVETDGRATHDTPHQFEEDRRRDLELTLAGRHVVRVGWRQLVHEPERVAALLASALRPARLL